MEAACALHSMSPTAESAKNLAAALAASCDTTSKSSTRADPWRLRSLEASGTAARLLVLPDPEGPVDETAGGAAATASAEYAIAAALLQTPAAPKPRASARGAPSALEAHLLLRGAGRDSPTAWSQLSQRRRRLAYLGVSYDVSRSPRWSPKPAGARAQRPEGRGEGHGGQRIFPPAAMTLCWQT